MNRRNFVQLLSLSPFLAMAIGNVNERHNLIFEKNLSEEDIKKIEYDYQNSNVLIHDGWILSEHEVKILKRLSHL